jgi:hypothetical protein
LTEETRAPWLNHMALATVFLAVCATLSTFKGGSYSTLSVISQALSSDQWAFYQAKSTKQHLYEMQVQQFTLQAQSLAPDNPARAAYGDAVAKAGAQIVRYDKEKQDIKDRAIAFEQQRDAAKQHGKPFGLAVIFLQVAILLNSVAGLLKVRQVWWSSIPVGIVGVSLFSNGFLGLF